MKFAAGTDRGLIRELNEDSYNIITNVADHTCVFIIADGMGGHNGGEIASRMAVDYISNFIAGNPDRFLSANWGSELKNLVEAANTAVYQKSLESPEINGMGTTLTMAVVRDSEMTVAHVGDSRLYLARNGEMSQVTADHSYIEELVRKGSLTREEAEKHPRKNVITRALGCTPELEVDILNLVNEKNDLWILCTDGLTNMLSEDEIYETAAGNDPETACKMLIEAANRQGGEDNITVIVIKYE